jgi:hypothetical protein
MWLEPLNLREYLIIIFSVKMRETFDLSYKTLTVEALAEVPITVAARSKAQTGPCRSSSG